MKKIIIANWKMKMRLKPAVEFARRIREEQIAGAEVVLAPSFPALAMVKAELKNSRIKMAAQNIAPWPAGAYTGEVSGAMLKDAGCSYAIIGHSERREYFNESDQLIHGKICCAYQARLTPILCVGETAKQKSSGQRQMVLINQLKNALTNVPDLNLRRLIIAYEPVWAIGAGQTASPADLADARAVIKQTVSKIVSAKYYETNVRFIYGGSVDGAASGLFWREPGLHGFLVGGASLVCSEFMKIVRCA